MRRTWILVAIVVMVAALLAAPGTALAKGPHGHDKTPGVTCDEFPTVYSADNWDLTGTESGEFTFELEAGEEACYDVTGTGAGAWKIDVSGGYVRYLALQIKDSVPGDICWSDQLGPGRVSDLTTWPITTDSINAGLDACGTEWSDSAPSLVFLAASSESGKGKKRTPVDTITLVVTPPSG